MNATELKKLKAIDSEYYYIQDVNPNSENFGRYWKARFEGYTTNKEDAYKYPRVQAKEIINASRNYIKLIAV